jgi:acetyltransferase-like isoleucine patch superfamily enzyme
MVKMSEEAGDIDSPNSSDSEYEVIKEEVKMHYHVYITLFALIFYTSWVFAGILFFYYVLQFFLPNVLETHNFLSLFTEFKPLLSLLAMPFVLIGCYLLHLFFLALATRILWKITEKISPSKEGIIPRNIRSKAANYYHIRSFMIKYGKNSFAKGVFPWLSKWYFNFIGASKMGKGTTIEESIVNDKFLEIGDNCYIGVDSAFGTHVVEGIFGNISYFKIKVGNNVTAATSNLFGPGSEIHDDSYLLPWASGVKHTLLKGNNFYWGLPLRRIFRRKIMQYLDLSPIDLEKNENIEGYRDKKLLKKLKAEERNDNKSDIDKVQLITELSDDKIDINTLTDEDLAIDFTTSSAISRVNIKFLAIYLPIFFVSGLMVAIFWYWYLLDENWLAILSFLPLAIFGSIYFFILACLLFSKLFLILINLIHKPKEGVFKAEIGDTDFEFWMMRTEIKKIGLWLLRNSPFPWTDVIAFKSFGVDMDTSSHLTDTWCDGEFIKFGRKNLIGQAAVINSSLIVGKYLLIRSVILDDYVMIGTHTTIVPGTIIGKETMVGGACTTTVNQVLEPGWIYTGIPATKFKLNKYALSRREILMKRDVDGEKKFEIEHEVNIDEDKRELIKSKEVNQESKKKEEM